MTSRITRRSIRLRSALVAVGAWKTCGYIAAQSDNGLSVCLRERAKATGFPGMVLFLCRFHSPQLLFPLFLQRASYQPIFWLYCLILPLCSLGLISCAFQPEFPLLAFRLLLLL